jgi:RNA recognition motif-containing protein
MRIFIVGFPDKFEKDDLLKMFEAYGTVKSAVIARHQMRRGSKTFGFVEMVDKEAAMKAIQSLNKTMLRGQQLLVTKARLGN